MKQFADFNYSEKLAKLKAIVQSLQSTSTELDEAIKLHAEGQTLAKELKEFLSKAENEVMQHIAKAD